MTKKFALAILTAALCAAAPLTQASTIIVGKHITPTTGSTGQFGHKHRKGDSGDGSQKGTGDKHKKGTSEPNPEPPPQS